MRHAFSLSTRGRTLTAGLPLVGALLLAAACGEDLVVPDLQTLTVTPDSVAVLVGDEVRFEAAGRDRFGKPLELNVTWTVMEPEFVEEVSSTTTGLRPAITVRALAPGKAWVRAGTGDGPANSGIVLVRPGG